jgi:citrate lyase subunit beta/citryl-CoA lyase
MENVALPLLLRSMLFVPGDSEKKLASAANVCADALVLDLEDSVAPARKAHARALVAEFLSGRRERNRSLWVRVNPFDTPECRDDLAAVMPARPDGIVLPKARSAADVVELGVWLDSLEQRCGVAPGGMRVLPIVTETPAAVLALSSYLNGARRLAALTWGAEDLSVALGAATNVDERGAWLPPFELARSGCLLAAAAAGVPAIDTVFTDLRDVAGLARQARAARRAPRRVRRQAGRAPGAGRDTERRVPADGRRDRLRAPRDRRVRCGRRRRRRRRWAHARPAALDAGAARPRACGAARRSGAMSAATLYESIRGGASCRT